MGLYVAFDDSKTDPTYTSVEEAYLVDHDNPDDLSSGEWVPVLPSFPDEIRQWAALAGFTVTEVNGKLVIETGVSV